MVLSQQNQLNVVLVEDAMVVVVVSTVTLQNFHPLLVLRMGLPTWPSWPVSERSIFSRRHVCLGTLWSWILTIYPTCNACKELTSLLYHVALVAVLGNPFSIDSRNDLRFSSGISLFLIYHYHPLRRPSWIVQIESCVRQLNERELMIPPFRQTRKITVVNSAQLLCRLILSIAPRSSIERFEDIFFQQSVTDLTIRSKNPSHQGAASTLNLHLISRHWQ